MMFANESDFVKDFVDRTLHNYYMVEKDTPYEITLLINSAIGLLIIPKEKEYDKITDTLISDDLYKRLKECIIKDSYSNETNLSQIIRHLRNAISHAGIGFSAEKEPVKNNPLKIHSVQFTDTNKVTKEKFEMIIPIDLLREFFLKFAEAVKLNT